MDFPYDPRNEIIHNPSAAASVETDDSSRDVDMTWMTEGNGYYRRIMGYLQGLGLMSLLGDLFHITETNICWRWSIPNNWVMFNWDIYQPLIYPDSWFWSIGNRISEIVFWMTLLPPCRQLLIRLRLAKAATVKIMKLPIFHPLARRLPLGLNFRASSFHALGCQMNICLGCKTCLVDPSVE